MADDTWLAARLIPTSGINGAEEQERRATSALLAVMTAVREFGRSLTQPYGAPAGPVETFIEVAFTLGEKQRFPDGLFRVSRGRRQASHAHTWPDGWHVRDSRRGGSYLVLAR